LSAKTTDAPPWANPGSRNTVPAITADVSDFCLVPCAGRLWTQRKMARSTAGSRPYVDLLFVLILLFIVIVFVVVVGIVVVIVIIVGVIVGVRS
jgi:hypothetical protein